MSLNQDKTQAYLYVAPAVILVGIICIYPIFRTLIMSFTDNDGLNPENFIGIKNYVRLFLDPNYITPILSNKVKKVYNSRPSIRWISAFFYLKYFFRVSVSEIGSK